MSTMKRYKIKDCFSLRARIGWQGLRAEEFTDYGPYLVTGTDFVNGKINWDTCYHVDEHRYKQDVGIQLRENDLLVTKDGTVGKTAFVVDCPEKATLNSHIFLVRTINGYVVPEYLYYVLNSHQFDVFLRNILTGTTIKGLTQENFYKFSFEAPDAPRQAKIAEVLSTVDEAIDKTRALIDKYKNIKAGMMQDLLTNRIEKKNTVRLGDFADVLGGKRLPKGSELTIVPTDHPYIRVRDITGNKVLELADSFQYVDSETHRHISRYTVDAGDLIVSIVGTIGAVAIIGQSLNNANLTENCAKIVHIKDYNTEFLYYYLSSAYGQNEISKRTIGEVQAKLPLMNILDIPVPIISIPEQEAIVEKLTAADEKIQNERTYLEKLQNIKLGLMQDLLDPNGVSVDALM